MPISDRFTLLANRAIRFDLKGGSFASRQSLNL